MVGGGGAAGRWCVRLVGGQWALYVAELTLARAGGGEDKKKKRKALGIGDVGRSSKAAHRQASNAGRQPRAGRDSGPDQDRYGAHSNADRVPGDAGATAREQDP